MASLRWNFCQWLTFISTWNIFTDLSLVFTGARKRDILCVLQRQFCTDLPSLTCLLLHHISLIILNIVLHQTLNLAINGPNTFLIFLIFINMAIWAGLRSTAFMTGLFVAFEGLLLVHCHIVTCLERAG